MSGCIHCCFLFFISDISVTNHNKINQNLYKVISQMESLDLLPNEILKMVLCSLDLKSAQKFSLTSKRINKLTLSKLWSKPRYTNDSKNLEFLHKISRFPIRELHTRDFKCNWLEMVALVPQLQFLHIDTYYGKFYKPEKSMLPFLKVPVIIHTNTFGIKSEQDFDKFLAILSSIEVEELIIDHGSYFYDSKDRQRALSIEEFKLLSERVRISELHVISLDLNEENVKDFMKVLASIKNCTVIMDNLHPSYLFTVKDLESMVKLDIKIILIDTSCLAVSTNPELLNFVKVMRKMKYLKEFRFCNEDFRDEIVPPPMEQLTDLPFKSIATDNFRVEEGKVGDIVNILSQIKSLKELKIRPDHHTDYKMSPSDFALFKDLPVTITFLCLEALNLTKENEVEFRQIMKQMKITNILWFDRNFEEQGFEIDIKIDGVYETI
uniref:F-box domain-containing protein n=1 Tax=Clytia hemisphaerica TaxID=252671 RepID=A0A7M5WHV2_9CNID